MKNKNKDLKDRHVLVSNSDWNTLQEIIEAHPTISSFSDALHLLIEQYQQNKNEDLILKKLQQIRVQLGGISKDVSMGNHMVGELFYLNGLEFVRHGVTPEIKATAMKLVDDDIKNAQERKANNYE